MKKDAYYFPHFCNARHDRKMKRLIKELGIEGYGIYFMLLEVLREQQDFKFPLKDIDLLADEFGTSEAKIKTVISAYELFQFDEENQFFSLRFIYYLQPYLEKTENARNAANIRWSKMKDANALQEHSDSNTYVMQGKERKVKESKVKDVVDPTLDEVKSYFIENGYTSLSAEKAYKYYDTGKWHDSKGNKVKNWKMKMQSVWFKDENAIKVSDTKTWSPQDKLKADNFYS